MSGGFVFFLEILRYFQMSRGNILHGHPLIVWYSSFFLGISFPACSLKPVPSVLPLITWCGRRSTINLWLCLLSAPLMIKKRKKFGLVLPMKLKSGQQLIISMARPGAKNHFFYSYLDFYWISCVQNDWQCNISFRRIYLGRQLHTRSVTQPWYSERATEPCHCRLTAITNIACLRIHAVTCWTTA